MPDELTALEAQIVALDTQIAPLERAYTAHAATLESARQAADPAAIRAAKAEVEAHREALHTLETRRSVLDEQAAPLRAAALIAQIEAARSALQTAYDTTVNELLGELVPLLADFHTRLVAAQQRLLVQHNALMVAAARLPHTSLDYHLAGDDLRHMAWSVGGLGEYVLTQARYRAGLPVPQQMT